MHIKFYGKKTFFVGCIKKTNKIMVRDYYSEALKIIILHKSHKMLFFREILYVDIEHLDVHLDFVPGLTF
jgi:hypothetical protein